MTGSRPEGAKDVEERVREAARGLIEHVHTHSPGCRACMLEDRVAALCAEYAREQVEAADAFTRQWIARGSPRELQAHFQSEINRLEVQLAASQERERALYSDFSAVSDHARDLKALLREPMDWRIFDRAEWELWRVRARAALTPLAKP